MRIALAHEQDFAGFRDHARALLAQDVAPGDVHWSVGDDTDLFADETAPVHPVAAPGVRVPAALVALCEQVALHADPQRFALMYRLLWRMVREPALRDDPLDADVLLARRMARAVSHEMHKMRAFVRFRPVGEDGLHVAWFEPAHHIVDANAPWFRRRFANMRWAILTPRRCVAWDGRELAFRGGASRDEAPAADAGEQLWLAYYRSIFNPARLKLATMRKEMPARYWRNLPEAQLIAPLAATAAERTGDMVERPAAPTHRRVPARREVPVPRVPAGTIAALNDAVARCSGCALAGTATQAVHGEGAIAPALMLVGEQPGDQEDLAGRPFVGPAGQLLDRAMAQAGIARGQVFLTNAVRHFKHELRGRRRIHKTPAQAEVLACSQWLAHEIALVQPRALVALGATAARALLGRDVAISRERGAWHERADGRRVYVTTHPSAILRLPPGEQDAAFTVFVRELRDASYTADRISLPTMAASRS